MRMQHKLVVAVAGGAVGIGAAVAGIADATTGPAPHTLVNVVISDSSIKLSKKEVQDVTFVDFYIHNTGKLAHTMAIGRKSRSRSRLERESTSTSAFRSTAGTATRSS